MKRSETHDSVDEKDRLQAVRLGTAHNVSYSYGSLLDDYISTKFQEANIFAISAAQDFSLTPTDSQLMEMCKDFDTEKSFTADGSVREPEE